MKILFAEDEKSLSKASTRILTNYGYDVTPVYDGVEALKKIEEEYFDLLLLDVMMPKKSGIEVLKELRQKGNDIKIIMLTAKSEIDDKVEGLENGADDYITKPFEYKELRARINAVTKNIQRQQQFEIHDVIFNDKKLMLFRKENQDAVCSITQEEAKILRCFAKKEEENLNILLTIFDEDETRLMLYLKYLNNKFLSISSVLNLVRQDNKIIIKES